MINNISSNFANTITPYTPVGRSPVGEENADLKSSTLKPAEQASDSGRAQNRRLPDDRPNDEVEQDRQRALARADKNPDATTQSSSALSSEQDEEIKQKEVDAKARDAEEARKQQEQERIAQEEAEAQRKQEQFAAEQRALEQRAALAEMFTASAKQTNDVNRRFLDLNFSVDEKPIGHLLDKTV